MQTTNRRDALKSILQFMGLASIGALSWGAYLKEAKAQVPTLLYPPGARENFSQTCIRCGLCIEACPYSTLRLSGSRSTDHAPYGLPIFTPRENPCFMCSDIPCAVACPTDALEITSMIKDGIFVSKKELKQNPKNLDISKARMGVAVMDTLNCIAYSGISCDACYRACPLIGKAIYLEYKSNEHTGKHAMLLPMINNDICTGCGKCEHACITDLPSVRILPRSTILGKLTSDYIKSWEKADEERLKNANTPAIRAEQQKVSHPNSAQNYLNSQDLDMD